MIAEFDDGRSLILKLEGTHRWTSTSINLDEFSGNRLTKLELQVSGQGEVRIGQLSVIADEKSLPRLSMVSATRYADTEEVKMRLKGEHCVFFDLFQMQSHDSDIWLGRANSTNHYIPYLNRKEKKVKVVGISRSGLRTKPLIVKIQNSN